MSSELSMRKVKEILRQKLHLGHSHREVAQSAQVSIGVVSKVVNRAAKAGLEWSVIATLDEDALDVRLNGPRLSSRTVRPAPDPLWMHVELKKVGVTLELLHLEYLERHPDGYRYTQFCEHYRAWRKSRRVSMRQAHKAGERLFVDYSGKKPCFIERRTGKAIEVELFVAVLGASNLTYAEATLSQQGPQFVASHVRTFEYIGGAPELVVPDQLRSGVSSPCWYEPGIQRTYEEMAEHYGTTVLPARPRHPRDKAKVEVGVQVVQRWIVARLRNERFFSIGDLNARIAELLEDLNNRPMRSYGGKTRRELFEATDKPALRALPVERFVYCTWKTARVNIDYHFEAEKHLYSAPYTLIHQQVDVRLTATSVEAFHKGERVAAHPRSGSAGRHTTLPAHMPKAHQEHLEWSPSRVIHWAASVGPHVEQLVTTIMEGKPHPEQGYRTCLGMLRLGKLYGAARLDAACRRALDTGARSYRHVNSILKHGLDRLPAEPPASDESASPANHGNVRGPGYYH